MLRAQGGKAAEGIGFDEYLLRNYVRPCIAIDVLLRTTTQYQVLRRNTANYQVLLCNTPQQRTTTY